MNCFDSVLDVGKVQLSGLTGNELTGVVPNRQDLDLTAERLALTKDEKLAEVSFVYLFPSTV
jgi:hypothetical protein